MPFPVFFGRNPLKLFEKPGKIVGIAEIQLLGNFRNGSIRGEQKILCFLEQQPVDVRLQPDSGIPEKVPRYFMIGAVEESCDFRNFQPVAEVLFHITDHCLLTVIASYGLAEAGGNALLTDLEKLTD